MPQERAPKAVFGSSPIRKPRGEFLRSKRQEARSKRIAFWEARSRFLRSKKQEARSKRIAFWEARSRFLRSKKQEARSKRIALNLLLLAFHFLPLCILKPRISESILLLLASCLLLLKTPLLSSRFSKPMFLSVKNIGFEDQNHSFFVSKP